jgi:hypothetical protein
LFNTLNGTRVWAAVEQVLDRAALWPGAARGGDHGRDVPGFASRFGVPTVTRGNGLWDSAMIIVPHYNEFPGSW